MVNWIHAVMFILTDAVLWSATLRTEYVSLCRECAVRFAHSNKSSRNHLATINQKKKKKTLSVLSLNVSYYSQVYLLFSLSPVRLWVFTVRLSCSDQTSWADWGSHEGPFKQRRCGISPRVKHHFYFWHHKAVFKNNWEPTAADSWKWSFGGIVWRREMLLAAVK